MAKKKKSVEKEEKEEKEYEGHPQINELGLGSAQCKKLKKLLLKKAEIGDKVRHLQSKIKQIEAGKKALDAEIAEYMDSVDAKGVYIPDVGGFAYTNFERISVKNAESVKKALLGSGMTPQKVSKLMHKITNKANVMFVRYTPEKEEE